MLIKICSKTKYLTFDVLFKGLDNFEHLITFIYFNKLDNSTGFSKFYLLAPELDKIICLKKPQFIDINADIIFTSSLSISFDDSIKIAKAINDNF